MSNNTIKILLIIIFCSCLSDISAQSNDAHHSVPFTYNKPQIPIIPESRVLLTDFGGNPDGYTLNSDAFEQAISYLSQSGGGHLDVTDGVWLTGPIKIRSNVDIHLSKNAIILFSPDKTLYPIVPPDRGTSGDICTAPISASGQTNFSITGCGIIDGNGEAWRPVKRFKVSDAEWKSMSYLNLVEVEEGKSTVWYPTLGNNNKTIAKKRPRLLRFIECSNFLIQGVTVQNSPSFHVNMILCKNFTLDGITVRCPWNAQNGDGIDLSSCTNVLLNNCSVDAGDDAICLKSGIGEVGRSRGASSDIVIENCTVFHGHGGFVIGSDTGGGMNNIFVNKCRFIDTDTGLRFKSGRDRGGLITNVWINDIVMCDIAGETILIDCYYQEKVGDSSEVEISPITADTPIFKGININGITCTDADRAILIKGLPEMNVKDVNITNSTFTARSSSVINYASDVTLRNVKLNTADENPISTYHSNKILIIP